MTYNLYRMIFYVSFTAFAIMLMVLAHTWFMDIGNKWINMFHMPLFFFLSGMFFHPEEKLGYGIYKKKRWFFWS